METNETRIKAKDILKGLSQEEKTAIYRELMDESQQTATMMQLLFYKTIQMAIYTNAEELKIDAYLGALDKTAVLKLEFFVGNIKK